MVSFEDFVAQTVNAFNDAPIRKPKGALEALNALLMKPVSEEKEDSIPNIPPLETTQTKSKSNDPFMDIVRANFETSEIDLLPIITDTVPSIIKTLEIPSQDTYHELCKQRGIIPAHPLPTVCKSLVELTHGNLVPQSVHVEIICEAMRNIGGTEALFIGARARDFLETRPDMKEICPGVFEAAYKDEDKIEGLYEDGDDDGEEGYTSIPAFCDSLVSQLIKAGSGNSNSPKIIVIKGCNLSQQTVHSILEISSSLMILVLEDCCLSDPPKAPTQTLMGLIFSLLSNTTCQLIELDVSNNRLGPQSLSVLRDSLKQNSTLKSLSLNDCGLLTEGVNLLADGLSQNKNLERLQISDNPITDLTKLLISCSTHAKLAHLDLSEIEEIPQSSFFQVLTRSFSLQAIHVSAKPSAAQTLLKNPESVTPHVHQTLVLDDEEHDGQFVIWRSLQVRRHMQWDLAEIAEDRIRVYSVNGSDVKLNCCPICENLGSHNFIFTVSQARITAVDLFCSFATGPLKLEKSAEGWSGTFLVPQSQPVYFAFSINKGQEIRLSEKCKVTKLKIDDALFGLTEVNVLDNVVKSNNQKDKTSAGMQSLLGQVASSKINHLDKSRERNLAKLSFYGLCSVNEEKLLIEQINQSYEIVHEIFCVVAGRKGSYPFVDQRECLNLFVQVGVVYSADILVSSVNTKFARLFRNTLTTADVYQIFADPTSCIKSYPGASVSTAAGAQVAPSSGAPAPSSFEADSKMDRIITEHRAALKELSELRKSRWGKTGAVMINVLEFIVLMVKAAVFIKPKLQFNMARDPVQAHAVIPASKSGQAGQLLDLPETFRLLVDELLDPSILQRPLGHFPSLRSLSHDMNVESTISRFIPVKLDDRSLFGLAYKKFASLDEFVQLAQLLKLVENSFPVENAKVIFALAQTPRPVDRLHAVKKLSYEEFIEGFMRLSYVYMFKKAKPERASRARVSSESFSLTSFSKSLEDFFNLSNDKIQQSMTR